MYRVPIHHDDSRFRDQTDRMFRDMQLRMNQDIGTGSLQHWPQMQSNWQPSVGEDAFFHLNPRSIPIQQVDASDQRGSREVLDDLTVGNLFIEDPQTKSRTFRMSFDVKKYDPKEIQTRVEDKCLLVEAKQVGPKGTSEFSRRIQLPDDVEADKLTSTLSSDGVLTLEAPCPPKYQSLTSSSGGTTVKAGDTILIGSAARSPLRSSPITVQMPLTSPTSQFQSLPAKYSPISIQHNSVMTSSPQPAHSPVVISVMPCTPSSIPSDTPVFTTIDGGRRRLDLVLDLGRQYAAQDVVVKVDGRKMIIEATREEKEHGRVCRSTVQREFDLSEDIDPGTVQAMMRPDGQLAVIATSGYKK
jgi:HSP20 family molecular chaperone IbpA